MPFQPTVVGQLMRAISRGVFRQAVVGRAKSGVPSGACQVGRAKWGVPSGA